MLRSRERLLTTHGGSLPRALRLRELFAARARGADVGAAELAAAVRAGVEWVVPAQIAAGIDIGNNGEQPHEGFFHYIQHRMAGFGGAWERPLARDLLDYPELAELRARTAADGARVSGASPPKCIGPVVHQGTGPVDAECAEFRAVLGAQSRGFAEPFLTAPSPGIVALGMKNEHYDSEERYLDAVANALAVEYRAIVEHGFLLQIDAPDLAMERHFTFCDGPVSAFIGFVERTVAAINRALAGIPAERVRLHVCWGNYEGPHDRDVALAEVLPALGAARVGGFVLPQGNPRHQHEYRCIDERSLGSDRVLIAGVIDTTTNYVEHPEVVADRLVRTARAIGDPTRLIAGTDCGFDTTSGMGRVAEAVVWAKLRALAEGARIASDRLFRGGAV